LLTALLVLIDAPVVAFVLDADEEFDEVDEEEVAPVAFDAVALLTGGENIFFFSMIVVKRNDLEFVNKNFKLTVVKSSKSLSSLSVAAGFI